MLSTAIILSPFKYSSIVLVIVVTLISSSIFTSTQAATSQLTVAEAINQSEQSSELIGAAFYQSYDVAFIAKVFLFLRTTLADDFHPVLRMLLEDEAFLKSINQEQERWSFEELIGKWFQGSTIKTSQTQSGKSTFNNEIVDSCRHKKPPRIAKNFKHCFCLKNCSVEDSLILGTRFARQIKAIYFAKNMNQADYKTETNVDKVDPSPNEGVMCHNGLGCCYYIELLILSKNMEALQHDVYEFNGGFVINNCTRSCTATGPTIFDRSDSGGDPLTKECVSQIYSRRNLQANKVERCELSSAALQNDAIIPNRNNSVNTANQEIIEHDIAECSGEERQQALYLLAYSQIGLLSIASFIMVHYIDSCAKHYQCSQLWPDLPKHPLTLLHDEIATHTNISLAFDAVAIVLNVIVIALLIRSTRSNVLSSRAAQFLMHICVASALYGVFDLATGILNFYSGAILNRTATFLNEDYLKVFCCDADNTMIGIMLSFEDTVVLYSSVVLQILKNLCQFASLSLFVAYGVFQIVPLVCPFKSYSFLEKPKQLLVFVWIASLCVSLMVNVLPFLMYISLRPFVRGARELDVNTPIAENIFNSSLLEITVSGQQEAASKIEQGVDVLASERSAAFLLSAGLIDVCLSLFLLFVGEIAYFAMVVIVVYVIRSRKKLVTASNLQQQHANSRNTRTVKSLVTMFISLSALCLSSIPSHLLTITVMLSSNYDVNQVALRDLVGADIVSQFVRRYMRGRVALLIEPILSPLLLLIRYENLTMKARDNRVASVFATSTSSTPGHNSVSRTYSTATTMEMQCSANATSTC